MFLCASSVLRDGAEHVEPGFSDQRRSARTPRAIRSRAEYGDRAGADRFRLNAPVPLSKFTRQETGNDHPSLPAAEKIDHADDPVIAARIIIDSRAQELHPAPAEAIAGLPADGDPGRH